MVIIRKTGDKAINPIKEKNKSKKRLKNFLYITFAEIYFNVSPPSNLITLPVIHLVVSESR